MQPDSLFTDMENLLASHHNLRLGQPEDALTTIYCGLEGCIFTRKDLAEDFFDLRNGLAGEIFQKFVNYRFPIAIVLPADHGLGNRVTELAREHVNHNMIRFCESTEIASEWLVAKLKD